MPVGCIPEKIMWGDTDFVKTFREDCSPSLQASHALPTRPLRWRYVEKLSGIWTRRICDVLERPLERARDPDGGPKMPQAITENFHS